MSYHDLAFIIGRILFGGFFLISAMNHFSKCAMLAEYSKSKGVPSPKLAVFVSGLLLLVGGLGVIFGVYIKFAVLALALFLIPVSFFMHAFWKDQDPNMKMMNRVNFLKNMALLGASLLILSLPTPWFFSL